MPRRGDVALLRIWIDRAVVTLLHVRVHRLVRQVYKEGTAPRLVDERDRTIGEEVGRVSLLHAEATALVNLRVHRSSLPGKPGPVVEPRTRGRIVPHVPLADERRFVAGFLQRGWK